MQVPNFSSIQPPILFSTTTRVWTQRRSKWGDWCMSWWRPAVLVAMTAAVAGTWVSSWRFWRSRGWASWWGTWTPVAHTPPSALGNGGCDWCGSDSFPTDLFLFVVSFLFFFTFFYWQTSLMSFYMCYLYVSDTKLMLFEMICHVHVLSFLA